MRERPSPRGDPLRPNLPFDTIMSSPFEGPPSLPFDTANGAARRGRSLLTTNRRGAREARPAAEYYQNYQAHTRRHDNMLQASQGLHAFFARTTITRVPTGKGTDASLKARIARRGGDPTYTSWSGTRGWRRPSRP